VGFSFFGNDIMAEQSKETKAQKVGRLAGRDPLPSPTLVIVGRCAGVAREAEACRDSHAADTNASRIRSTSELILKGVL
jgi:hypothetical protein